jgi:hypothetical protein
MKEISYLINHIKNKKTIDKDELLELLSKINKQFELRMIKNGINDKFYCHDKEVLAGSKRCGEVCHYCLVKGNLVKNKQ